MSELYRILAPDNFTTRESEDSLKCFKVLSKILYSYLLGLILCNVGQANYKFLLFFGFFFKFAISSFGIFVSTVSYQCAQKKKMLRQLLPSFP